MNLISAINNQGHFPFMSVEGSVTARVFIKFLKRRLTGVERKIILVVDGQPTRLAKLVSNFVKDNRDTIELAFLPPYPPELNPAGLVWAHLKKRVAKKAAQTKEEMVTPVKSTMRSLQKSPATVAGFFRTPIFAYARS